MKLNIALPFLLAGATTLAALAQAPAVGTNTAPVRRPQNPAVRSPELGADRTVTFRLRAAKAAEVFVNGQWPQGRAEMTKETNDVWSVTVGPVPPGVWEYGFQVDGLAMIDPGNPAIKPMREPRTSILQVPGNSPSLFDFQDAPHGVVREHTYRSKVLGRLRELTVYTPPGYDLSPGKHFPTLYLQHGSGDNQATWIAHGKAHWILDNLIAQGRAKPMVIVMMDGHAALNANGTAAFTNNTALFERDLLEEVLPFIEANYRVKPKAIDRAIAGLSMGGGQSLTIGLNHADKFAWVGGFSSAAPTAEAVAGALENSAATNRKLRLLWVGIGCDDFLLKMNEAFLAQLKEHGIHHEWRLTAGGHSWPLWRDYLAEFVPKLFR